MTLDYHLSKHIEYLKLSQSGSNTQHIVKYFLHRCDKTV
jgi:hypothetical protein